MKPKLKSPGKERGIALVITLGVLSVLLLLAVAFALSSHTEAKSGANYDVLVASKSLAKVGMDRCLMEIAQLGATAPYSGSSNYYVVADLTQLDGTSAKDTSPVFSGAPRDFVNVDSDPTRASTEPYWIGVKNAQGKLIGRFAYTIVKDVSSSSSTSTNTSSGLVDINAIGNIYGANDSYIRTNNGYIGSSNGGYTNGVCGDVNLVAFLEKLGYSDPTTSARKILSYRYGWTGGTNGPTVGWYKPGNSNVNENADATKDEPSEYDPVSPGGSGANIDHKISDLAQVQSIPIASDPAYSYLSSYATISSGDNNLINPSGVTRTNLNATRTGNTGDVAGVVAMLQQVFPTNNLNQLTQWAVNLIDFHTTNLYPTVYTGGIGGTNRFYGIKRTPYLNQILIGFNITLTSGSTAGNKRLQLHTQYNYEVWNPFSVQFVDNVNLQVTNTMTFYPNSVIPSLVPSQYVRLLNSINTPDPGIDAGNLGGQDLYSPDFPTNAIPFTVTISNVVSWVYCGGPGGANNQPYPNLITGGQAIGPPITLTVSNNMGNVWWYFNVEADDPRLPILFAQTNQSPNAVSATLPPGVGFDNGATNYYTCDPNGTNASSSVMPYVEEADHTNREGIASFYVKMTNYSSIAEIGYVHRGEQWKTIRLQPGGDWALLDRIRLNDLKYIYGRIDLYSPTDGPLGALQSPAFFALFKGLSNSAYGTLTDAKITNIVSELGTYRSSVSMTNIGQVCELGSLITDLAGTAIPTTNDAGREYIIRNIANLITTTPSSSTEIVAWGQAIRGNEPAGLVQIRAWYKVDQTTKRIQITKFQYATK